MTWTTGGLNIPEAPCSYKGEIILYLNTKTTLRFQETLFAMPFVTREEGIDALTKLLRDFLARYTPPDLPVATLVHWETRHHRQVPSPHWVCERILPTGQVQLLQGTAQIH